MRTADRDQTFTEAARRAQIVEATIVTINELGYHRTSLAGIAERASVAKSAIVYYFGSKDALLLHVVDQAFTALGDAIWAAVTAESAPLSRLRAYATGYIAHVDAHRADVAAAATIVVSHRSADGTPLYLLESDDDTALLRGILSAGMDAGALRRMPLPDAVHIVESLLDLALTEVQRDLAADLTTLAPEAIEFLLRGFTPPGTPA